MSSNKKRYYGKKKKQFINKPESNFNKAKRLIEEGFSVLIDVMEENSPEAKQYAVVKANTDLRFAQAIIDSWKDVDQATGIIYCHYCGAYAAPDAREIVNHTSNCIYMEAQLVISNFKEKNMQ